MPTTLWSGNYSMELGGSRDDDNYPMTTNVTVITGNDAAVSIFQVPLWRIGLCAILLCAERV